MTMGYAIALLCATLNVFFRDVGQLLTVALQVVLWTAPIVYAKGVLPDWAARLLPWHPLYPPLVAVRELFLNDTVPAAPVWIGTSLWPLAFLALAQLAFTKLRPEIRDVL
jgi:lipopolysaccharide transport system permease protein